MDSSMTQPEAARVERGPITEGERFALGMAALLERQGFTVAAAELRRLHAELERCKQVCAATSESWRTDAEKCNEAIDALKAALVEDAMQKFTDVNQELEAALAEPVLQTCNCRWDGEMQMQQCTLHEAHVDAIHEWAERAKTAEKKLAALAEPPDSTKPVVERHFCPRCGKRTNGIHTCTPPAPLTDEVIADLWHQNGGFHHHFARAIERWLKGNP